METPARRSKPPGAQPGPAPPDLSESLPASSASDVPIDALLVLRFSKPLQVDTLNGTTVLLSCPGQELYRR